MQKALISDRLHRAFVVSMRFLMLIMIDGFKTGGYGVAAAVAAARERKSDHQIRLINSPKQKKTQKQKTDICTYPTSNPLGPKLAHGLHHTPLLVNDLLNPICPPRRNENMCRPSINPAI